MKMAKSRKMNKMPQEGYRAAAFFDFKGGNGVEGKTVQKRIMLDPRLQKCADFVRAGVRIADVGTDHGYLPIALLQSGKASFASVTDIHAAPLESARRNAEKYGVAGRMRFLLSDGLHGISPQEADDIVIAGMGGELILRILSEAPWLCASTKHLILQPMTTAAQLRHGLSAQGFSIDREEAVFDGKKIYSVLSVFYTGETSVNPPSRFVHMGEIRPGSPYSARYAQSVLHNLENKCRGILHAGGDASELRAAICEIRRLYLTDDLEEEIRDES